MQVKVAGPGIGVYPVDATVPVKTAVQALAGQAEERGIRFATRMPEVISLVNAPPQDLVRLMHSLLETLLNDAAENTAIDVAVEERDNTVSYRLSNTGFGIPNERFQDYLFGGQEIVAEEFKALHDALRNVSDWEGRVAANSEVGSGMAFDLELRAVI
jgi:C4-dicarboxylate-specific signal transduction histidine kinase